MKNEWVILRRIWDGLCQHFILHFISCLQTQLSFLFVCAFIRSYEVLKWKHDGETAPMRIFFDVFKTKAWRASSSILFVRQINNVYAHCTHRSKVLCEVFVLRSHQLWFLSHRVAAFNGTRSNIWAFHLSVFSYVTLHNSMSELHFVFLRKSSMWWMVSSYVGMPVWNTPWMNVLENIYASAIFPSASNASAKTRNCTYSHY